MMLTVAASTKSEQGGGLTFALQALLSRHESYMAEAEEERKKMAAGMEQLENEKKCLQSENARVVQENKDLLHQLEGMNNQIADSDAHIQSLMATLSSAQFENKRLMALAARTAELEAQLTDMEIGQASLREELVTTKEDERSALQRWKSAETRLRNLNEQVQKIEREAHDERERHVEVVGRMERRSVVEKELESAAGRLKGAAAASTLGKVRNGTNVVSHFVRDILQDNANLQAGIMELRELLDTSNEEVQNLREQVLRHQPLTDGQELQPSSLREEIELCRPKAVSQEVHVHHHYHAKITAKKERGPSFRRPPRRRGLVSSMSSTSSAGCQTPVPRHSPNIVAMQRPINPINRWSTQSSATDFSNVSSQPTSPYSDHRTSSIFDRIDPGFESSRPTSPESVVFPSPRFQVEHQKPLSELDVRLCAELTAVSEDKSLRNFLRRTHSGNHVAVRETRQIAYEDADSVQRVPDLELAERELIQGFEQSHRLLQRLAPDNKLDTRDTMQPADPPSEFHFDRLQLRRSGSNESLVSISGMDIHLPQQRSAPLRLLSKPSLTFETTDPLNFSIAFPSPQPLASIAEVNASSSSLASSPANDCPSPVSLLSGLAGAKSKQPESKGLGRLVGSWVRGRWGIAPMASTGNLREQAAISDWPARTPGINQKGPIMGWKPPPRTPSEVHAKVVNEGLLQESLAE
jgi:hypothetical protein